MIGYLVESYASRRCHSRLLTIILLPKLTLGDGLHRIVPPLVTSAANVRLLNIAFLPMVNVLRHYLNPGLVDYASWTMSNQTTEHQMMNIRLIYRM